MFTTAVRTMKLAEANGLNVEPMFVVFASDVGNLDSHVMTHF